MDQSLRQTIDWRGVQLTVRRHDRFWDEAGAGNWEASTLDVFDRRLPGVDVFVDFGAWIGPTSLYASRYCRRILAFEPDPSARAELLDNIASNGLSSIETLPFAISPREGEAMMWDGGKGQGQSVSSLVHGLGESFSVGTMTPAQVLSRIGDDASYFVKMDIEGGEYALSGVISQLFGPRLAGMLIAFHPRFIGGRGPLRFRTSFPQSLAAFRPFRDFDIYRVSDSGCRPARVVSLLTRAGLPLFEAKESYLFLPR